MNDINQLSAEEIVSKQQELLTEIRGLLSQVVPLERQVRALHIKRENLRKLHAKLERRRFSLVGTITKLPPGGAPKRPLLEKQQKTFMELAALIYPAELRQLLKGEQ